jgi:hypothetical protein
MAACFQWALVTKELRNGSRAMPSAPSPPSPASIDREALPPTRLQPCSSGTTGSSRSVSRRAFLFRAPIVLSESSIRTPSPVFGSGSVPVRLPSGGARQTWFVGDSPLPEVAAAFGVDDDVDAAGPDIGEQALQRRPLQIAAGEPTIVVAGFGQ